MLARVVLASSLLGSLALAVPAAHQETAAAPDGRFDIDPTHSQLLFKVRHLGVSNFWGRINKVGGKLLVDAEDPSASLVQVTIDAAGIDTNDENRDIHLRSADFFNVEEHPTLSFTSEKVVAKGPGKLEVSGELELHGVARPLTVLVEHVGFATDPRFGTRAGYETRFTIKRSDFGMDYMPELLGDEVEIVLSLEGVKP
jgi:polyisoprenoid-binding protein YceI